MLIPVSWLGPHLPPRPSRRSARRRWTGPCSDRCIPQSHLHVASTVTDANLFKLAVGAVNKHFLAMGIVDLEILSFNGRAALTALSKRPLL